MIAKAWSMDGKVTGRFTDLVTKFEVTVRFAGWVTAKEVVWASRLLLLVKWLCVWGIIHVYSHGSFASIDDQMPKWEVQVQDFSR